MQEVQYIKLTRDLEFRDFAGRFTTLLKDTYGALLNAEAIGKLEGTDVQKTLCLEMLIDARKRANYLATVAGYICVLQKADFEKTSEPKMSIVPIEITGGLHAST